MGTSMSGWSPPATGIDLISDMSRDVDQMRRRTRPPRAGQILGPGVAPQAVRIVDWNGDETLFNGFFYSELGALNGPNPAKRWMGTSEVTTDREGVQLVHEMGAVDGQVWRRTFTADVAGVRTFNPWRLQNAPDTDGVWQEYTPVMLGGSLGAGGSTVGRYALTGDTVEFVCLVTLGVGFNLTSQLISIPVIASNIHAFANHLTVKLHDVGQSVWAGSASLYSTSFAVMYLQDGVPGPYLGNVSNGYPFAWGPGDEIAVAGTYRRS